MARSAGKACDVAIVGAGVSGLYCAWRLTRAYPGLSVQVFEASERLGGRLYSLPREGFDLPIELGALSFSDAHENVAGLARTLGLARVDLQIRSDFYALRGTRCSGGSLIDAAGRLYALAGEEGGKPPAALLLSALMKAAPELARLWPPTHGLDQVSASNIARYLRSHALAGRPLWRLGLWNVLSTTLSGEAYEFLLATIGIASGLRQGNACDAIWTMLWEMRPGQRHYQLRDGYQSLCVALADAAAPNARIRFGGRLRAIAPDGDGLRLSFDVNGGAADSVTARRVILALPQASLAVLTIANDIAGPRFSEDLSAVTPLGACKLFFLGKHLENHAETKALTTSRIAASFTDLPIRQAWRHENAGGRALLMAAFADDAAAAYWPALADHDASNDRLAASHAIVAAARAQLRALFDDKASGEPDETIFIDWGHPPNSAAWHAWRPGVQSWRVRARIAQPNPDAPLFICGEAFAQTQGWVEGAINNAEMMLERHFGVGRPHWVAPHYPFEV